MANIMKERYNTQHLNELTSRIADKPWKETILAIPAYPRKTAVALFRITMVHNLLAKHLFCLDNADTILHTV